jgi:hypothetical protein
MTQAACTAAQGSYRGNGTTCANDICVPRGACCNPTLSPTISNCISSTQAVCANLHGTWNSGVSCEAANCPPPTPRGACCASAINGVATCEVVTEAACADRHGHYNGNGTSCTATSCPHPCVCDWNHSGSVTSADLHDFLTDFLAGHADINGDGVTDVADLNAFLECFNHPPASCTPPLPILGGDGIIGGSRDEPQPSSDRPVQSQDRLP